MSSRVQLRRYPKLPVFIVEDHHEVLAHIYRTIASRHLPFKGVKMIHLDSHPDLQIPNKIKAQDIFKLEELSKHLSIENWIFPAMLAGHLDHVVWVKPPWADQLPEGQREVVVGEHKDTGTIRINWPDEYYLSDVMYASAEEMRNPKTVKVDIVTVDCGLRKDKSSFNETEKDSGCASPEDQGSSMKGHQGQVDGGEKRHEKKDSDEVITNQEISSNTSGKRQKLEGSIRSKDSPTTFSSVEKDQHLGIIDASSNQDLESKQTRILNVDPKCASNAAKIISKCLTVDVKGQEDVHFILDIDLDFFSTQNPFQMQYSQSQYSLLKELYTFEPPVDLKEESISLCQQKRESQLADLDQAIRWCWKGEEDCDFTQNSKLSERWRKMAGFIKDVRKTSSEPLDPELIHMAGQTTCDDEDDLPHHVSSEEEITGLIRQIKQVLRQQPKPTVITIARSSEDDYCPKHQVEFIQAQVIHMLEELYGDLEVKMDYEITPVDQTPIDPCSLSS